MNTTQAVVEYLKDKTLAWSSSTLRSEEARLTGLAEVIDGNPQRLWDELERRQLKPYTRVTIWSRVCDFWQWRIDAGQETGPNSYRVFRKRYAKQFKNVYVRKTPDVSFTEAKALIETLPEEFRWKALELLTGGLRYTESSTLKDGLVVGKGGKVRSVFPEVTAPDFKASYQRFLRALKGVGLKPHMLRKIFATAFVNQSENPFLLMEVMGWSNITTAQSYVSANKDKARRLVEQVQGRVNERTEVSDRVSKAS